MSEMDLDWRERIARAQRLIEQRLDEDIPLDELAETAHASTFHFHRLYRGFTGETVREYARRLRLELAAQRLIHHEDDILCIALDSGYESHEAFTRAFKRHFGCTPSSFREERREIHSGRIQFPMEHAMDIRIERCEQRRIAYVRHVGPYNEVGGAWGTLMKWGWSRVMFKKAKTFGLCFDDPDVTPPDRIRYEACMVVDEKAKAKGEIRVKDLPACTYAVTLHEGSFDTLGGCYAGLFARIASGSIDGKRWKLGDPPSLERYLCDPRKVKPEDMRTEICMEVTCEE